MQQAACEKQVNASPASIPVYNMMNNIEIKKLFYSLFDVKIIDSQIIVLQIMNLKEK